jgi:hypothetical protein
MNEKHENQHWEKRINTVVSISRVQTRQVVTVNLSSKYCSDVPYFVNGKDEDVQILFCEKNKLDRRTAIRRIKRLK